MIAILRTFNGDISVLHFKSDRQFHLKANRINIDVIQSILISNAENSIVMYPSGILPDDLVYIAVVTDASYDEKIIFYHEHEALTEYLVEHIEDLTSVECSTQVFTYKDIPKFS